MDPYKTSIVVNNQTRDFLRSLGKKDQTYDQIILELLETKKKSDLLEVKTGHLNPSKY